MASITNYFKRSPSKKRTRAELEGDGAADEQDHVVKSPSKKRKSNQGTDVSASPVESKRKTAKVSSPSTLTEEQKARIAENKAKAMAKLQKVTTGDSDNKTIGFDELKDIFPDDWKELVGEELEKPYFDKIIQFLQTETKPVYPPTHLIFNAFQACPFDKVRVVILGQDPYHGPGQAEGMCFSVPKGVKVPSSLQNIYKELTTDIRGFVKPKHGHLIEWAHQGVFLLNTGLTVRANEANSHVGKGWQQFTDVVISKLAKQKQHLVFLLWGKHAQDKAKLIPADKHLILKCAHPSGLSASKGFYGCKHFSQANQYLAQHGMDPIDWQIHE